jgi:ATP-dependent DNA ligase
MLLLRAERLPEGPDWLYELKLDGYRALAVKSGGRVQVRSRNDKDFNARYPALVEALGSMPDETVIDGEIVALDGEGRPSFNGLQNRGAGEPLHFFIFALLILRGRDVMAESLVKRRALIEKHVLPTLADPIRYSPILEASLPNLIRSVKAQGLEGLVAKRRDSKYEPGGRSGAWAKMRVNRSQEFVIGGYTLGGRHYDALIFGYWEGDQLMYAARTRSSLRRSGSSCTSGSETWRRRSVRSRICRRRGPDDGVTA